MFLEHARNDQWRANILLQLAESLGDEVGSLSDYIDMLLATSPPPIRLEELGELERGTLRG